MMIDRPVSEVSSDEDELVQVKDRGEVISTSEASTAFVFLVTITCF